MVSYDLGLPLPSTPPEQQRRLAAEAEAAGYDALLVAETWGREAFARLGYLAAHTDEAMLGTGIVPVYSRSPALLAQAAATVDELTGGRALLGLGLSGPAVIEGWHGVDFEPALRRQRETIEVVRQALSGGELTYDGEVFDLDGMALRFDPPREEIPIYVAAQGERNSELTGGFADGWMPNRIPLSELPAAREHVDRGARRQDRAPDAVETAPYVTTCVLEDGETARDRCRSMIAFYVGAMGEYHYEAVAGHGFRETADRIRERWSAGEHDAARAAVSDDLLAGITVSGAPEDARERFEAYDGVADRLVTLPPTTASVAEVRETVEHVGDLLG